MKLREGYENYLIYFFTSNLGWEFTAICKKYYPSVKLNLGRYMDLQIENFVRRSSWWSSRYPQDTKPKFTVHWKKEWNPFTLSGDLNYLENKFLTLESSNITYNTQNCSPKSYTESLTPISKQPPRIKILKTKTSPNTEGNIYLWSKGETPVQF